MVAPDDTRIAVGVDGSHSSLGALDWAVRQAGFTGAVVEAINTWEWPTSFGWAVSYPDGWDPAVDAQKMLDEAVKGARATHPDVTIRSTVVRGHPAPVLVEASRGADLIVIGSRGHGEFTGMLLGSVSQHCVTNAHCPVLVLRDES